MVTIATYGTLITRGWYRGKKNARPVIVRCFRRFYRKSSGFPVIVRDRNSSLWVLAFDADRDELSSMDMHELGYFTRERIVVEEKSGEKTDAWIYIPKPEFLLRYNVKTKEDLDDNFLDEIRASKAAIDFPELMQRIPRKKYCEFKSQLPPSLDGGN